LLGVDQLDVFYLHAPDPNYPLEQTLGVLAGLYDEGIFARFGMSNFPITDVISAAEICKRRGWKMGGPKVYQGNYSAFARHMEEELLPELRRLGVAFYAYSPLAGGFLARKGATEFQGDGGGRFAKEGQGAMTLYQRMYSDRPGLVKALEEWAKVAEEEGCESPAELGYRWIAWNSALDSGLGDKIVVGASKVEQVHQVAGWISKGQLRDSTVSKINQIWEVIKDEAPLDNWQK
jgi:aflatoxin B1 aldehyde reductase